jgi:hypothetical protein
MLEPEAAMPARSIVASHARWGAVAVALVLAAGCHRHEAQRGVAPDEARQLLINRNWIDVMPQRVDDKLHVFRFVPSMGGGVFQDRTIFAGAFELFQFRQDGRTIDFDLLHTGKRQSARFTIEPIAPRKKGDFDLKLTLDSSPRGPSIYYSWRQGGADLDGELRALWPR